MGKHREKKTAKGRLDKWYQLAKDQGYRARSAFKLLQINRKYDFLSTAKCVIDLCAAPGGWLQVAAKQMPANSLIIGVDLAPIKPIPRCTTFVDDITSDSCKRELRNLMKDWKADVVMHDGAPNVGQAWVQDAFTQADLVLASLRLTTDFLALGGTFVTKVFRSKDYNSLMWVFEQFFKRVEAMKPPSSRNVSAEIFVICSGYKAPKDIDPKMLSSRYVFTEVDDAKVEAELQGDQEPTNKMTPTVRNVLQPEKKNRHREGYDDDVTLLVKEKPVTDYIKTRDPIGMLGTYNRLTWDRDDVLARKIGRHPLTTDGIKTSLDDLRTLGKSDFRQLMKWRQAIRRDLGWEEEQKQEEPQEVVEQEEPEDEDEALEKHLSKMADEELRRRKREKRHAHEKRQREALRLRLNMAVPQDMGNDDIGFVGGAAFDGDMDEEMLIDGDQEADFDEEEDAEESDSDLSDRERHTRKLEESMDILYDELQNRRLERDSKAKVAEQRKRRAEAYGGNGYGGEWRGIEEDFGESEAESDDEDPQDTLMHVDTPQDRQTKQWFDRVFSGAGVNGKDMLRPMYESRDKEDEEVPVDLGFSSDEEQDAAVAKEREAEDARRRTKEELGLTSGEAMTLAMQLANREKTREQLVDDGYNRNAYNVGGDDLPSWFVDDEMQSYRANVPVTKEAMAALRARERELNARPIKKIAEAKSRKKLRTMRRIDKARAQAEHILEDEDDAMTQRDKSKAIAKVQAKTAALLANGGRGKSKKPPVQTIVARKGGTTPRPRKGRYRMVDRRMKKDLRAEKRASKRKAGKKAK